MRVTLDIDDDVLDEIRAIAARRKETTGTTVSRLLREHLTPDLSNLRLRNGVPLFKPRRELTYRESD